MAESGRMEGSIARILTIPTIVYRPEEEADRRSCMSEELSRNQFSIGKDCAGLGEVVGHIKELILFFLDHRSRSLDNEKKGLQNQRLVLENAAILAELATRLGCSEEEIRLMIGFDLARFPSHRETVSR